MMLCSNTYGNNIFSRSGDLADLLHFCYMFFKSFSKSAPRFSDMKLIIIVAFHPLYDPIRYFKICKWVRCLVSEHTLRLCPWLHSIFFLRSLFLSLPSFLMSFYIQIKIALLTYRRVLLFQLHYNALILHLWTDNF